MSDLDRSDFYNIIAKRGQNNSKEMLLTTNPITPNVRFKVTREECEAINEIANLINAPLKTFMGYPITKQIKPSVNVSQVIVQPDKKVIVVIFANGDKSIVKCGKDDTFSVENGVAIAITKYVLGSGSELKRLVKNATIQEVKKPKEVEIVRNTVDANTPPILDSDKIEVGDTVEIIETDNPNSYFGGIGRIGVVESIDKDGDLFVGVSEYDSYNATIHQLKLIKKGEKI